LFEWIGTLAVAIGDRPAGAQVRARCAHFLTFRGDKIVALRSYDCFDPW
jgi:ketosteroid isomerase-like protein